MRTPLSWISLYAPLDTLFTKYTLSDLEHAYSTHTAEIDAIISHDIDRIVVGKIQTCERHPNSRKLFIVTLDLGVHGTETILTGADNVAHATYVPVAMIGTVFDGNFTITEREMAGMKSRGMICSEDELGLSNVRAEGILILEQFWNTNFLETQIGKPFFQLPLAFPGINGDAWEFPIGGHIFEIDNKFITNRSDLFSIIGNAREWHTIFNVPFSSPIPLKNDPIHVTNTSIQANIETTSCLAYSLLEMDQITLESSPIGMRIMLHYTGGEAKYDCVDITNLIMIEYGQPLHVFDADKITGNITVRMAKDGESFVALNGRTYTLTPADIVIADDVGVLALAGIIGGMNSAVTVETTHILWESATFDATSIRLSAQHHGIRTDASTRYEKTLDPILAGKIFPRILEYLHFLKKSPNIIGQFSFLSAPPKQKIISLSYNLINNRANCEIPIETIHTILTSLGFQIVASTNAGCEVEIPSWRSMKDITIAEDLVEEVLRIYGYDRIPAVSPTGNIQLQPADTTGIFQRLLLQFFALTGWHEVYNYSFSNTTLDNQALLPKSNDTIKIINAYTEDFTHMRQSLAPHIFAKIGNNIKLSENLQFFEIGNIFGKTLPQNTPIQQLLQSQESVPFGERKKIAGACTSVSIADFRNNIETLLYRLFGYVPPITGGQSQLSFLHPGVQGKYCINDDTILVFGKIHPAVATNFEIPENTIYFESDVEILQQYALQHTTLFKKISPYPSIPRELNFIVNKNTETGSLARKISTIHPWISEVVVDSIYEDNAKIGNNKKSVNFSFYLQSMDATISDIQASEIQQQIIDTVESLGYPLRTF